jgi:hypothetical protein
MYIIPNRENQNANCDYGFCIDQQGVVHIYYVVIEVYILIKQISAIFRKEIFTSDYISCQVAHSKSKSFDIEYVSKSLL